MEPANVPGVHASASVPSLSGLPRLVQQWWFRGAAWNSASSEGASAPRQWSYDDTSGGTCARGSATARKTQSNAQPWRSWTMNSSQPQPRVTH